MYSFTYYFIIYETFVIYAIFKHNITPETIF